MKVYNVVTTVNYKDGQSLMMLDSFLTKERAVSFVDKTVSRLEGYEQESCTSITEESKLFNRVYKPTVDDKPTYKFWIKHTEVFN